MHLRLTPSTGSGAGDDELRCNVQHGRQPTAQRAVRHAPQRVLRLGHPGVAAEHEAGDKLQRTCCWLDNPLPLLTLHWVGLVHAPSKTTAATVHCCMRPEIPHVHCRSTHRSTSTFCSLTAACVDHICHHTGQRFVPVPPHWLCAPLQLGWSDTNPLVQSMSCSCCCTHPACRRHFHAGSGTVSFLSPAGLQHVHWTRVFTDRINNSTKLVGPTISCEGGRRLCCGCVES